MEASLHIFYLFYLLINVLILGAHGVIIQLYKHANFTGLVLESNLTGDCNNVPSNKLAVAHSIRTDTCFIAYWDPNCKSHLTEKYLPGDIILSEDQLGRKNWISSLQTCNEEEGGNQLNVDIKHIYTFLLSNLLESYKNVCSCVNIPQHVQNMPKWSVDNHHNSLLAYYEPDCSVNKWGPEFIAAGHHKYSNYMHYHKKRSFMSGKTYKVQSFGPDPNSTYFQTSCSSSDDVTKKGPKSIENTTEGVGDLNDGVNCKGYQVLANELVELKTQFNQFKENQEKFQSEMLQQFRNFTSYFKLALDEQYA